MRVVVLADTHLRRGSPRGLPLVALAEVAHADVVLHAGDILTADVLEALAESAPTHAVLGNNDAELVGVLPERLVVELAGVKVAMVHDSGPRKGRGARLHRVFPDADLVVFGHSHIPWSAPGLDGQWLLNPGSPTQRRSQPRPTLATVDLYDGEIERVEIIEV